MSSQYDLSPLELEVAACLPVGQPTATVPDLATDAFDDPLVSGSIDPETSVTTRRRLVRNALSHLEHILGRATGERDAMRKAKDGSAKMGCRRLYAVSRKSSEWITFQTGKVLNSPIQAV